MIKLTRDSIALGDTFSIAWELPSGAKILRGPQGSDSLFVTPDSAIPGLWRMQPLSVAAYGGDTLQAIAPTGDTLTESVPTWAVHPKVQGSDSSAASLLPPESVKVPFPWDYAGIAGGSVAAVLLAIYAWRRYQAWKRSRLPPPPPPPPRDPVEVAREKLQELVERSRAGHPPRETAFACGELLRQLHGALHDWTESVESTSFEWKDWCRRHRPTDEQLALDGFLAEADLLRYADATHDAEHLLDKALVLLDAQGRLRNEKP